MIKTCKKPPVYFPTVTGDICSFNSQYAGLPLKSCTSLISGYQEGSGIPSPDNVRPLHAFSNADLYFNTINQWDEVAEVGTIDTATGKNTPNASRLRSTNYILVNPNTTYYINMPSANNEYILWYEYDSNKNFIRYLYKSNGTTVTTTSNTRFVRFSTVDYGITYNNDISINYPATDTSYHAFSGAVFTFGQSIYQGSIDWKRDVVVGLWSGKVDMGLLNWGYNSNFQAFYIALPNMYIPTTGQERMQGIANEVYPISTVDAISSMDDKSCLRYNGYLWTKDSDYTDRDDFKNSLIGKYVAYELATPIEIPLGGINLLTQRGVNNIFADCGNTTLEYLKAGR